MSGQQEQLEWIAEWTYRLVDLYKHMQQHWIMFYVPKAIKNKNLVCPRIVSTKD